MIDAVHLVTSLLEMITIRCLSAIDPGFSLRNVTASVTLPLLRLELD